MANIGDGRPLRVCDSCGAVDDHPRHSPVGAEPGHTATSGPSDAVIARVTAEAPPEELGRLLRDLMDTTTVDKHLDCCVADGCPLPADDPSNCNNRLRGSDGATGADLLAHLAKGK
jgi:hypothetical protein